MSRYQPWKLSVYSPLMIVLSLEIVRAWPCRFSPYTGTDWYSLKDSREPLCRFLDLFFYMTPYFHIFCSKQFPWTLQILILVSLTEQYSQALFAFYLLALKSRKFFQTESLANGMAFFICFPFFRENSPALLVVQWLKIAVSYIFSSFLVVYDWIIVQDPPNVAFILFF